MQVFIYKTGESGRITGNTHTQMIDINCNNISALIQRLLYDGLIQILATRSKRSGWYVHLSYSLLKLAYRCLLGRLLSVMYLAELVNPLALQK